MAKKDNSLYTPGTKTKGGGTYTPGTKTEERLSNGSSAPRSHEGLPVTRETVTPPVELSSHLSHEGKLPTTYKSGDAMDRWTRELTKSTQVSGSQIKKSTDRSGAGWNTATGSARDSRPEQSKQRLQQWWSGDAPTARETLARIVRTTQDDSTRQRELLGLFMQTRADKTSPFYDMYAGATNTNAIAGLSGILEGVGIEMPGVITSDFLTSLQQYADYEGHVGVSGAPLAPTKSSTPAQDLAYWLYQLQKDESTTQKAETEWADLQTWIAEQVEAGLADDEILAAINWGKYSTLRSMDEGRVTNVPVQLNRGIGYSEDALYGALWAARNNGGTGDLMLDAAMYTLGEGTMLSRAAEKPYNPRADVTNYEMYSPYTQLPEDFQALANAWGVDEITEQTLQSHRDMLTDPDAAKVWNAMYKALDTTKAAQSELESFYAWAERKMQSWRSKGLTDEEIWEKIEDEYRTNSDYATLRKLEEARVKGNPLDLTSPIDFSLPGVKRRLFGVEEEEAETTEAESETTEEPRTLSASLPGLERRRAAGQQGGEIVWPELPERAPTADSLEMQGVDKGRQRFVPPEALTSIMVSELTKVLQGRGTQVKEAQDWFDEYGWLLGAEQESSAGGYAGTRDARKWRREGDRMVETHLGEQAIAALEVDRLGEKRGYLSTSTRISHAMEIAEDFAAAQAEGRTLDEYYTAHSELTDKFDTWAQEAQDAQAAQDEARTTAIGNAYGTLHTPEGTAGASADATEEAEQIEASIMSAFSWDDAIRDETFLELSGDVEHQIEVLLRGYENEWDYNPFDETQQQSPIIDAWTAQGHDPMDWSYLTSYLADQELVTDAAYAQSLGMSLGEFYEAHPEAQKTPEELLQAARTRMAAMEVEAQKFLADPEAYFAALAPQSGTGEDDGEDHSGFFVVTGDALEAGGRQWWLGQQKKVYAKTLAYTSLVESVRGEEGSVTERWAREQYSREEYRALLEGYVEGLSDATPEQKARKEGLQSLLGSYTGDIYGIPLPAVGIMELKDAALANEARIRQVTEYHHGEVTTLEGTYFDRLSGFTNNVLLMLENAAKSAVLGGAVAGAGLTGKAAEIAASAAGLYATKSTYGDAEGAELALTLSEQTGAPMWQAYALGQVYSWGVGWMEQHLGVDKLVNSGSKMATKVGAGKVGSILSKLGLAFDEDKTRHIGLFSVRKAIERYGMKGTAKIFGEMALAAVPSEGFQEMAEAGVGMIYTAGAKALLGRESFTKTLAGEWDWNRLWEEGAAGAILAMPLGMFGTDVAYFRGGITSGDWGMVPGLGDMSQHEQATKASETLMDFMAEADAQESTPAQDAQTQEGQEGQETGNGQKALPAPSLTPDEVADLLEVIWKDVRVNSHLYDEMNDQIKAAERFVKLVQKNGVRVDSDEAYSQAEALRRVAHNAYLAARQAEEAESKQAKAQALTERSLLANPSPENTAANKEAVLMLTAAKEQSEDAKQAYIDAMQAFHQVADVLRAHESQRMAELRAQALAEIRGEKQTQNEAEAAAQQQAAQQETAIALANTNPESVLARTQGEIALLEQQAAELEPQVQQETAAAIQQAMQPEVPVQQVQQAQQPAIETSEGQAPVQVESAEQQAAQQVEQTPGAAPSSAAPATNANAAAGQRSTPVRTKGDFRTLLTGALQASGRQRQLPEGYGLVLYKGGQAATFEAGAAIPAKTISGSFDAAVLTTPEGTYTYGQPGAPSTTARKQKAEIDAKLAEAKAKKAAQEALVGAVMTEQDGLKANAMLGQAIQDGLISPEDARQLQKQAGLEIEDKGFTGKAGLTDQTTPGSNKNVLQTTQMRILDALAQKFGLELILRDTLAKGTEKGATVLGTNRIYIGLDRVGDGVLQVGCHEMVHQIRSNASNHYAALREVVTKALLGQGQDINEMVQQRIEDYARQGEVLSEDQALEEIIAESMGQVFADPVVWNQFLKDNHGIKARFTSFFKNFWTQLREIAMKVAGETGEKAIDALLDDSESLKVMYDEFIAGGEAVRDVLSGETEETAAEETERKAPPKTTAPPQSGPITVDQFRDRTEMLEHDGLGRIGYSDVAKEFRLQVLRANEGHHKFVAYMNTSGSYLLNLDEASKRAPASIEKTIEELRKKGELVAVVRSDGKNLTAEWVENPGYHNYHKPVRTKSKPAPLEGNPGLKVKAAPAGTEVTADTLESAYPEALRLTAEEQKTLDDYDNDKIRVLPDKLTRKLALRRDYAWFGGNETFHSRITSYADGAVETNGAVAYVADPQILHARKTLPRTDYILERDKAAKRISERLGLTVERVKRFIDDMQSIAATVAMDEARLDYDGEAEYSPLKENSEYKWTVDFSTLCKKRLWFTGTFDAIQSEMADMVFNEDDMIKLREIMAKRGYEVACAFCYVEATRKNNGKIIQQFLDTYLGAVDAGKSEMAYGTKTIKYAPVDASFRPTVADFNTTTGLTEVLHKKHQYESDPEKYAEYKGYKVAYDAYLAYMNNRGSAKPKLLETRAAYTDEIWKKLKNKRTVAGLNAIGGLRLQSFSDFELVHILDMMQVMGDMARVGLKSQAYTKVPEFAMLMGLSGIKINLSLVTDGVDADGNLIFNDVEGMPAAIALAIRDGSFMERGTLEAIELDEGTLERMKLSEEEKERYRKRFAEQKARYIHMAEHLYDAAPEVKARYRQLYSQNVGTILVGKDEATIKAAMKDPRIDFIIPYHRSQWSAANQAQLGIADYVDHTEYQSEYKLDPPSGTWVKAGSRPKGKIHFDNFYPGDYWTPDMTPAQYQAKYLEMCAQDGRRPKFPQWTNEEGYWKLLGDFKMYDNDGNAAPQSVVGIEFDREMAQAALEMYEGAPTHLPVAWDALEEFKEWIAAGRPDLDVTRANFEAEMEAEKVARAKKGTRKKGSTPGRVTVGTEGLIRHSRYNQLGKTFAEQVDDYIANHDDKERRKQGYEGPIRPTTPGQEVLYLGETPEVLRNVGLPALPVVLGKGHLYRMLYGKDADHRFTPAQVKSIPDQLKDPIAVIASANPQTPHSVVALVELNPAAPGSTQREVVAVEMGGERKMLGEDYTAQVVSSVYRKNGALNLLNNALQTQGPGVTAVYYLDKKRANALLQGSLGLQLPSIFQSGGYVGSITDPTSLVKPQISSQTETSQFKRWFGESKAVNENGAPKVVYHGTNAEFTAFDPEKQGSATDSGDYGAGFYFDQDKNWSGAFGRNVGAYYLSLQNPIRLEYGQDAQALIDLFKEHGVEYNFSTTQADGSLISAQDFITRYAAEHGSEWKDAIRDDRAGKKAFQEVLRSMGIDGVIISDQEYVAFDPTQIKSATDNIGTFNPTDPDIRHSRVTPLQSEEKTFRGLFGKMGLQLTVGKNGYAATTASYGNVHTGAAHVRSAQDGTSYARELARQIGYHLRMNNRGEMTTSMIPQMDPAELAGLSGPAQRDAAFAEFVKRWLYDPRAAQDFAGGLGFVTDFEDGLDKLGWGKPMREAQQQLKALYDATAAERLAARIDLEATREKKRLSGELVETKFADKTYPLAKLTKMLQEQYGDDYYSAASDPRILMLANGNRGANWTNTILENHLVDPEGNIIREESLQGIMHRVGRKNELDFNTYMLCKHAGVCLENDIALPGSVTNALGKALPGREAAGKTVFGNDEQTRRDVASAIVELEGKHPEFKHIAEDLVSWYQDFMQTWVVNTGMLSQAEFDTMREMYPWYVPTFRTDYRTGMAFGPNQGGGTNGSSNGIQKATGSERDIYNPIMGLAENTQRYIDNYRAAEIGRAFARAVINTVDSAGIAEVVQTPAEDLDLAKVEDGDELSMITEHMSRGAVLHMSGKNIMTVIDGDGSPISIQINDPLIADMMFTAKPENMGKLFQMFGKVKSLITTTATAMSLGFSIPNAFSDLQTAIMTGSFASNPVTGVLKWLAGATDYTINHIKDSSGKGTTSNVYDLYRLFGQMDSRYNMRDRNTASEMRRKLYGGHRTFGEVMNDFVHSPVTTILSPYLNVVEWINDNIENATRYTEFKFGKHDLSTYEGRLEAGKAARDVTTDFSRTGSSHSLKQIRSFVPFLGATIEGVNKSIMLMSNENRGRRGAILAKAGEVLALGLLDGLCRAMFWTDDDKEFYSQLQSDYKAKYYIIPRDGFGHFLRIKKSQDSVYLLADALGNLIAEYSTGAEGDFFGDLKQMAYNLLHGATDITTIFDPILDVRNNETWYGTPIESYSMQLLPVTMRYKEDTAPVWIGISHLLNGLKLEVSPLDVEYLFRQYTGTYGTAFGKALRELTNGTLTAQSLWQIYSDRLTGRLTIDAATANQASNVFYDGLDFVTKIRRAYTQAKKSETEISIDPFRYDLTDAELEDAIDDTEALYEELTRVKAEIAELWDEYASYEGDPEAQRDIQVQVMHTAMEANALIDDYRAAYCYPSPADQAVLNTLNLFTHRKATTED